MPPRFQLAIAVVLFGLIGGLRALAAGAPPTPRNDADRAYRQAVEQADIAYWNALLQAKQDYASSLSVELKAAMQKGDLDEANRVNDLKKNVDSEIAAMNSGEPLTVVPHGPIVVASCGFNIKEGLGIDPAKGASYEVGRTLPTDSNPDIGWQRGWEGDPERCTISREAAFEGDAGLLMKVTHNETVRAVRRLNKPQTGKLEIIQSIKCPEAPTEGILCRPTGEGGFGPNWGVINGEFWVMIDRENGQGPPKHKTGIKCKANTWYTVTLRIDVPAQTWEFIVDGEKYRSDKPLPFRNSPKDISMLDYYPGQTFYLDNIKVIQLPDDK